MYVHDFCDLFEFDLFHLTSTHTGSYHIWPQRPVGNVLCSLHWPNPKALLTTTPQLVCNPCSIFCCILHLDLRKVINCTKDNITDSINAIVFPCHNTNIHIFKLLVHSGIVYIAFLPCVYSLRIFPGEKR